jgi:hypothetical protein
MISPIIEGIPRPESILKISDPNLEINKLGLCDFDNPPEDPCYDCDYNCEECDNDQDIFA